MAPPSELRKATDVLNRLVREEASYHKELKQQEEKLQKKKDGGPDGDENYEYWLSQLSIAIEETKRVFPSIHHKIVEAAHKANTELKQAQASSETTNDEEKTRATAAISAAKELDIWQHAQPLEA